MSIRALSGRVGRLDPPPVDPADCPAGGRPVTVYLPRKGAVPGQPADPDPPQPRPCSRCGGRHVEFVSYTPATGRPMARES
jgi:hypothetical protein